MRTEVGPMTEPVLDDRRDSGVAELLEPYDVVEDSGIMKGVAEKIPVFRVQPSPIGS